MQYTTKKPDVQAVNGKEMRAIEFLAAFDAQMGLDERTLEARLRTIPNGWRNFRMIRTQHHLLMDALYDTMPDTKRWMLYRTITTGQLIMRPVPASKAHSEMIVQARDVQTVCAKAIDAECAMCVKTGAEIRHCKLREAMQRMATPYEIPKSGCEYAHYSHAWEEVTDD